jgi:hypothetical protein
MAATQAKLGILDHFSALQDPRQAWKVIYPLPEIMLLILAATMASAEDFVEIEEWGEEQLDFLRTFLRYRSGDHRHRRQDLAAHAQPGTRTRAAASRLRLGGAAEARSRAAGDRREVQ